MTVIGQADLPEMDRVAMSLLVATPNLEFEVRYFARKNERLTPGEIEQAILQTRLFSDYSELVTKLRLDADRDDCSLLLSRLVCLQELSLDRHDGALALPRSVQSLRLRRCGNLAIANQGVRALDINLADYQTMGLMQGITSLTITNMGNMGLEGKRVTDMLAQAMPRLETLELLLVDLPPGRVHCPLMRKLVCSNSVNEASQLPIAPRLETVELRCSQWFPELTDLLAPAKRVGLRIRALAPGTVRFGPALESWAAPCGMLSAGRL